MKPRFQFLLDPVRFALIGAVVFALLLVVFFINGDTRRMISAAVGAVGNLAVLLWLLVRPRTTTNSPPKPPATKS
jgi:uncharacterized membrane protein